MPGKHGAHLRHREIEAGRPFCVPVAAVGAKRPRVREIEHAEAARAQNARDLGDCVLHSRDGIQRRQRVNGVDGLVRQWQGLGIPGLEAKIRAAGARAVLARLFDERLRQVDADASGDEGPSRVLDGPVREILGYVDPRTVFIEIDGDEAGLPELAMIERVERHNGFWQCTLVEGTDPQEFLAALADRCRVLRFEVKRPTLSEVFLANVSDAATGQEPVR